MQIWKINNKICKNGSFYFTDGKHCSHIFINNYNETIKVNNGIIDEVFKILLNGDKFWSDLQEVASNICQINLACIFYLIIFPKLVKM